MKIPKTYKANMKWRNSNYS